MKILILGDIYGEEGKVAVASYLPYMKEQLSPDLVIANGENVSEGGKSMIKSDYDYLKAAGVDYFTMGNHTFDNDGIYEYIDTIDDMVRPANLKNEETPGKGYIIFEVLGKRILLMNLLGEAFIHRPKQTNPFNAADSILMKNFDKFDLAIVDFHAEATAEKLVLGNYLSNRVGIFFGTHTHIQTADERILNGNMAYITDVGMCGVFDSAIGANFEEVEAKLSGRNKEASFIEAKGKVRINAILVTLFDNTMKPHSIERIVINP